MRRLQARSLSMALIALFLGAWPCPAQTPSPGQQARPPAASGSDAASEKRGAELDKAIDQHIEAGRIAQAIPPAREKLEIVVRLRGKDYWAADDARRDLETLERLAVGPRGTPDRFAEARRESACAEGLSDQGQYAPAAELYQKALRILREILGEEHPEVARSYDGLGLTLLEQGQYWEAEAMHRKALAINLNALGEAHPETARVYVNLAEALSDQGKYGEAEAMARKALAIRLKALGEEHPDTASSY
jgi:tetratricopeptide (TPR) repeat protein